MKKLIPVLLIAALALGWLIQSAPARVLAERERAWGTRIRAGDLLFQDLDCGPRCDLIREVTHSRYTHVGIVLDDHGALSVWEAYAPVGPTDLVDWVHRGIGERIALYRFDSSLIAQLPQIDAAIRRRRGLPYDGDYQWDDDRIYCSELIAKAVNSVAAAPVFLPRAIGSLGVHSDRIKKMSRGRLTESTPVVSPVDLIRSGRLIRVIDELDY